MSRSEKKQEMQYPEATGPRLVHYISLTPWALMCVTSALRRDAERMRNETGASNDPTLVSAQIAKDEQALSDLFEALGADGGATLYPVKTILEEAK